MNPLIINSITFLVFCTIYQQCWRPSIKILP